VRVFSLRRTLIHRPLDGFDCTSTSAKIEDAFAFRVVVNLERVVDLAMSFFCLGMCEIERVESKTSATRD